MNLKPLLLVILCFALIAPQPFAAQENPDARVILMDSRLRVRALPDKISQTLTSIDPETPLTVIGKSSGETWLQVVTPDEITGWVSIEYVELLIELETLPITYDQGIVSQGNKFPPRVEQNIRLIFARGQELGNRPDVFSKIGDSMTAAPYMFAPIGEGEYVLGEYEYLERVIDHYRKTDAREGNSFVNPSLAAAIGWTTSVMYDTDFSDKTLCQPDETPLHCEYRIVKPSVALIMLGTNDLSFNSVQTYKGNIAGIVDYSVDHGVIPILSTIPSRVGYEEKVHEFNAAVKEVADDFAVPLWDYYSVMETLANHGLDSDGVHPTLPAKGIEGSADFRSHNLPSGYVMRNLTALQMLDAVWRVVETP